MPVVAGKNVMVLFELTRANSVPLISFSKAFCLHYNPAGVGTS